VIEVISVAPIERASDHIDLLSPACRSAPSMRPRVRSSPPSTNAWLVIGGLIAVSMLALPLLRPPAAQVDMTRHRKAA
jgi:hypothetical protein